MQTHRKIASLVIGAALSLVTRFAPAQDPAGSAAPGVVCNIKVLSDKVPDVSSLDAWNKTFINDKMTNQEKGIAIWRSMIMLQQQDAPPKEFSQHDEDLVYDPIKMFNVYGYGMCSPHSAHMDALARSLGFKARGWAISHHSVCEFFYDNSWHHFDSSIGDYFLKDDGTVAGIEEIIKSITDWYAAHPEFTKIDAKDRDKKLRAFQNTDNRQGWKLNGPKLIANFPYYDFRGWFPDGMVGWYATMQCFDGTAQGSKDGKAYLYEYSASMGYQVNIQLRPGEKITRNWSNTGLHINQDLGSKGPGSLDEKNEFLVKQQQFTDKIMPQWPYLANGRVGNGTHEYQVPLASGDFNSGALQVDNLACKAQDPAGPALHVVDAGKPGVLVFRMPSSYVYLDGSLSTNAVIGDAGEIAIAFSDNNGLDWKDIAKITPSGDQKIDLTKLIARHYDYRLRFTLKGKGTGLDALAITQNIQHSQRPLPALDKGPNKIAFSAGAQESTITIEANNKLDHAGKQVVYTDFHPKLDHLNQSLAVEGTQGSITVPVATPGDMTRLRLNACYRTWGGKDNWVIDVSFDDGKTFRKAGEGTAQIGGCNMYCTAGDIPTCTKSALVRYTGTRVGGNALGSFRIDADYKTPAFGFRPIKVTYAWEEAGQQKKDVHIAASPEDNYTITCAEKPKMKSITLELAQ